MRPIPLRRALVLILAIISTYASAQWPKVDWPKVPIRIEEPQVIKDGKKAVGQVQQQVENAVKDGGAAVANATGTKEVFQQAEDARKKLEQELANLPKEVEKLPANLAKETTVVLGNVTREVKIGAGNVVRTYQKAGTDTVTTIHKAAEDTYATYTKAIVDGAREAQQVLDDSAEAVQAAAKFAEREAQALRTKAEDAERRVREGKLADAAWHFSTDGARSTEDNFFKATQDSSLINQAASTAAGVYGGPGGAAAYAAWQTYRVTGDPNMAFRAGLIAGASSQAGKMTAQMPSGTVGEVVKKAAMAGAAGGIAVAAAGGDDDAIKNAFFEGGGAVLIQSSKDKVKGYSKYGADAVQSLDCISARDVKCFSNTSFAKENGKLLMDKYGKPIAEALDQSGISSAWNTIDKTVERGKGLAAMVEVSKLPQRQSIPVMGNQYLLTWSLPEGKAAKTSKPVVVLTQVAEKPPFVYQVEYTKSEKQAVLAGVEQVAPVNQAGIKGVPVAAPVKVAKVPVPPTASSSVRTTTVYACSVKGFNRIVQATPYGNGCQAVYEREGNLEKMIWRSDHNRTQCVPKARAFVVSMRSKGLTCRQTA